MVYAPEDIQWEVGIEPARLKVLLEMGLPYVKDNGGHIWVREVEMTAWPGLLPSAKTKKSNYCRARLSV
jgi:hypothetical protein